MMVDVLVILKNILEFIDFNNKTVIAVGAGGGQFAEYGKKARRIIAVDSNPQALAALQEKVAVIGLTDRFKYHAGDFDTFASAADMVFFEFCLHEMADPLQALAKAKSMAPQVVIFDHSPDSPWAYITAEEIKVKNAWQAIQTQKPSRVQHFQSLQSFATFAELEAKVIPQGEVSLQRIGKYRGQQNFTIPMSYGLALL
ncbi:MAG: class I SAM-dependent methyltransferase [Acidobacteria bacterium]|nr:class I SAM-dependent methyltransferase [Acidobacteriota bacterium]MBU4307648.1 class I SAM-dependent methyltransferase [Acidobacteriota bacterium]MBU4404380.1 class I SAM-dependent methyltransferase [Acidobacteriota bacterium]MCG2810452.1 class I SAM-dependent methyltransferase [Candidatus Aminicenantes bacterium]